MTYTILVVDDDELVRLPLSSIEDDCESVLAELKKEFAEELPERLAKLKNLVPLAATGSPEALKEISAESHKLRGTAACFGQPFLGNLMGDIEDSLATGAEGLDGDACTWRNVANALNQALATAGTIISPNNEETSEHLPWR